MHESLLDSFLVVDGHVRFVLLSTCLLWFVVVLQRSCSVFIVVVGQLFRCFHCFHLCSIVRIVKFFTDQIFLRLAN